MQWRTKVAVSAEPTDSIVELRNGRTFKIRHRPMPDGGWVATHEDITEQRRSEVKIEYMAHHDALTDLANRVLLNERLEQALGRRIHREEAVAVHHLDLDQFKAVNDTFGHHAGDKLLKIVADRLRALVRETDTIARMGGDEFVIVQAPITDPAEATALAQRIIASISEPFDLDGHQADDRRQHRHRGRSRRRIDPRQAAAQCRPRALSGERRRARHLPVFRARDGPADADPPHHGAGSAQGAAGRRVRALLPAGGQPGEQRHQRFRGPDPLEPPKAGTGLAGHLHSAGRGDRVYRPDGRMGDPAGLRHRGRMAGRPPRRRQYFGGPVPQPRPDAGHRRRARGLGPAADAARDRNHRNRAVAQQGSDACRPAPVAIARDPDRDGRFRHRIFLADLSSVFSVRQDQDRPFLREEHYGQHRLAQHRARGRGARQRHGHDDDRRRRRNQGTARQDCVRGLYRDAGIPVQPAAARTEIERLYLARRESGRLPTGSSRPECALAAHPSRRQCAHLG